MKKPMYSSVGWAIDGGFNPALPFSKLLEPNACRRDFQPYVANNGFGKCILPCWLGINLAQGAQALA